MRTQYVQVRRKPVEDPPALTDRNSAVLAPGAHPRRGEGWILYYLDPSGQLRSHHIPHRWAPDIMQAQTMARQHLRDCLGADWE